MPDLLLELLSEEIPARMQARAEADLLQALVDGLTSEGLVPAASRSQSGPRRLCVILEGLSARSEDKIEERKGPKVGAPEAAIQGFLRGAGLKDISEAETRADPKKGEVYVATRTLPGQDTTEILAKLIPEIVRKFHWPKSMRTGRGSLRWVRPLKRILCLFDGAVVPLDIEGIASSDLTEGHRVHGRGPYQVCGVQDYVGQLSGPGHVMLDRDARREVILSRAHEVCAASGLELVEDEGLLQELVGLAEWPQVILGQMDPAFLDLPDEVVRLSMRVHQKYFATRDPALGRLAPHFVVVANLAARDQGAQIAAGNARVLSARLEDARFFWDNDRRAGLEAMVPKLGNIDYKQGLGTIADKVARVVTLSGALAEATGADPEVARRAAHLAKADLVSEMVYEFPELQGVMGRYYAQAAGEPSAIADAIADHYRPQGPSDSVPQDPVAITVALADKLDTLVGFWAIGEKPTGSKDPFALRRAALGVVRILLETKVRLNLRACFYQHGETLGQTGDPDDLLAFFIERLKQYLRDQGQPHDLLDAVFALGDDDLVLMVKRVEALSAFLSSEDGANLLAGFKRAANILKAEEKKGWTSGREVDVTLISNGPKPEQDLFAAITEAETVLAGALDDELFDRAMSALSCLRGPVDAFFENVVVNDDDALTRANRLALLDQLRRAMGRVADFDLISG